MTSTLRARSSMLPSGHVSSTQLTKAALRESEAVLATMPGQPLSQAAIRHRQRLPIGRGQLPKSQDPRAQKAQHQGLLADDPGEP
eukprot:CAMPEP_0172784502 /NCGR_PEP_ID=MMETSP1074-20121228/204974_1 /TAXON_ID=2916 /ORGANISM="Ceratium fusus, Strain PA161109" /LENGTH=84 /DNA_ID=CAMNT_0013621505 /DNA_START=1027 /DNA_END=1278 /DNA_ORIENTATION=+